MQKAVFISLFGAVFGIHNDPQIFSCDFRPLYQGDCPNYQGCHTDDYSEQYPDREPCSCLDFCEVDSNCCSRENYSEAFERKEREQQALKDNAAFTCENKPTYKGECPNRCGCATEGDCNCLDFCGYDDNCCASESYTCENKPIYTGNCPNYNNCHYNHNGGDECNCLAYCEWDSACCDATPMDWRSATAFVIADPNEIEVCKNFNAPPTIIVPEIVPEPEEETIEIIEIVEVLPQVLSCSHVIENDCSVTLTWDVVSQTGPVSGIVVSMIDGVGQQFMPTSCQDELDETCEITHLEFTRNGLEEGSEIYYGLMAQNVAGWSEMMQCPAFTLVCPNCPVDRVENSAMPVYASALTTSDHLQAQWTPFHAMHSEFSTVNIDLALGEVEALDNVIDELELLVSTVNGMLAEAIALRESAEVFADDLQDAHDECA